MAYIADQDSYSVDELYSVPILGGAIEKLNQLPVAGGEVETFKISPDTENVAFKGDLETDEKFELYLSVKASHTYLPAVRK